MAPVTPQDLQAILGAADAYVRNTYALFRQNLGNDKNMAEVGLTDLYMMKAVSEAKATGLAIQFVRLQLDV
jgi:aryl carrier-like protein